MKENKFLYCKTRMSNLFYTFYLLFKNFICYIWYRDSLKFIKDLTFDFEKFNYTYIKLLQGISSNGYLFNKEQKQFLLKYTNQVPFNEINHDIYLLDKLEDENTNLKINKDRPINSGIIALVYEGYITVENKEEKIAIKILKKDVLDLLKSSWEDLNFFIKIIHYLPFIKRFNIKQIFDFNEDLILDQLNFKKELDNLKLWKNYSDKVNYLYVPNYYEKFTEDHPNVLVMEYIEHIEFSDIEKNNKNIYLENIIKSALVGLFFYGLSHGDLHSGNVLFLKENKIAFIDFGISTKLDKKEQDTMFNFYKLTLISPDLNKAANSIFNLVYPISTLNNLSDKDRNDLIDSIKKNISNNFISNPDINKFAMRLTYDLSKYKLILNKGFSNTLFGVSSGIHLNLDLLEGISSNPLKDYNNLCIRIIKELLEEINFSFD